MPSTFFSPMKKQCVDQNSLIAEHCKLKTEVLHMQLTNIVCLVCTIAMLSYCSCLMLFMLLLFYRIANSVFLQY